MLYIDYTPINHSQGEVNMDALNNKLVISDDRGDCDKFMSLADRVSTSSENIMNNDNMNSHDSGARAERVGFAGIDHTNQNGAEARLVTNSNGSEARLATNSNGAEGRSVTEKFGFSNLDATHKEGFETRENIDRFGLRNSDAIQFFGLKNLEATKDSLKDLLISTKDDLKNVLISQKDDIKDLLISNKNDFKDVLLKNCQVEKDMLLQFKDAQLIAMQNKADLSAQIAECCCENKQLIMERSNHTDELIRKLDEQRVRDELAKTREELIALKIRSTIVPLPVAATAI